MSAAPSLRREDVLHAPEHLQPGVPYVSEEYETALHLCVCGCGGEVATPLRPRAPAGWTLAEATLRPCIGNQAWACRSHY